MEHSPTQDTVSLGYGCAVTSSRDEADPDRQAQYFDADPLVASKPRTIEFVLPDVYLQLATDSGVFSGERVDSGTRYLLQEHPPIPETARSILDLGCGYGVIGLTAASRAPQATVWGVDVNNRAIALANQNAASLGLTNAHFGTADDIPTHAEFDIILSNPPIRIGKESLHDLLLHWMGRLSPDGVAWMVVQKHLGSDSLASWLSEQGWPTSRRSSRKGFRILESRRQPPVNE